MITIFLVFGSLNYPRFRAATSRRRRPSLSSASRSRGANGSRAATPYSWLPTRWKARLRCPRSSTRDVVGAGRRNMASVDAVFVEAGPSLQIVGSSARSPLLLPLRCARAVRLSASCVLDGEPARLHVLALRRRAPSPRSSTSRRTRSQSAPLPRSGSSATDANGRTAEVAACAEMPITFCRFHRGALSRRCRAGRPLVEV